MRTALVGTDGTGKTTVLRRIRETREVGVVHAIRCHDDPHSPFAELSLALAGASAAADALGRVQLKVAVLYLQLCLYGPAERQAGAGRRILLADRHPLIDPLVYLPLFARLARDEEPGDDVQNWWRKQEPGAARAVRDWLRECSGGTDPWPLGTELLRLGTRSGPEIHHELGRRLGVTTPDAVLLLDLPVQEALRRIGERAGGSELHETVSFLSSTRQRYGEVLDWLGGAGAGREVVVRRIDCSGLSVDEVAGRVWEALEQL
ncbi:hypothetical protein [Streptomyces sp. SID9727]|uniref:hypothetical protein n=1 Tax=Streptomyces sp. SID9727 TaxID=2706114 RepID=UPI0013C9D60C|nr:hypothetical protein [Streptomyces sp. SID9727]